MTPHRFPTLPLVVGGVALVAAGGIAASNLHLAVEPAEVVATVEGTASRMLGRPVHAAGARVTLWPRPSVRLTEVRVDNLAPFERVAATSVEAVHFEIAWLPLVLGRVSVRRLVLEGPSVHLAVDANGTPSFGDLVPDRLASGDVALPTGVSWRARSVVVRDGSLSWFDARTGRSLLVTGARGQVSVERHRDDGWYADVALESDSILARVGGPGEGSLRSAGPELRLTALPDASGPGLTLATGILVVRDDTLGVRASASWRGPDAGFDVHVGNDALPADVLVALVPPASRARLLPSAEGRLGVSLRLVGGTGTAPALRGAVRFDDVSFRLAGEPLFESVVGVVALGPDTVLVDSLAGTFAGGPFELAGTLARGTGAIEMSADAEPDLARLASFGFTTLDVSGRARARVVAIGPLARPDSLELTGSVLVRELRLEHPGLRVPLAVPRGEVHLAAGGAHWRDVYVGLGGDEVVMSGTLWRLGDVWPGALGTPVVDARVGTARLDLDAALPADHRPTRPRALPFLGSLTVAADSLVYRGTVLDGVLARVELADSVLSVVDASLGAWGGRASASVRLAVGGAPASAFALTASVVGADGAALLAAMTALDSAVTGTLDGEVDLEGTVDTSLRPSLPELQGRVAVELRDGHLAGTGVNLALADFLGSQDWEDLDVSRATLDALVASGALEITRGRLEADAGAVTFRGGVRHDGAAELALALSIPPERLEGVSLRRTGVGQGVLERLRTAHGTLELGLRLEGRIQAPTLEPDASSSVAVAR